MSKPVPHKRPSLGPLEKPPKKRFTIDPNTRVLLKQILIGLGVFSVIALIITAIWYVTRLPAFTITSVTAAGGETIDASEVEARALRELEGAYGTLIPKRFFALYPRSNIYEAVSGVERIKDVSVTRTSRNQLAVTFNEYTPFALWCAELSDEQCFFIDERGYAFALAPNLSGGSFVRYRSGALAPAIGLSVLSFEDFWNTVTFTKLLETQGRYISSVEVDSMRDVYYGLVGGGELRAALSQSPDTIVENVRTIFASKEFSHLRPGNFKYVDLRFGNKVYVNEQMNEGVASSTATSSAEQVPSVLPSGATQPNPSVPTGSTLPETGSATDSAVIIRW